VCLRTQGDHVGQLAHRVEQPEVREAGEAERVEPVAREQGEVRVVRREHARLAVMQQVALAHRLDDEGDVVAVAGGTRSPGGAGAQRLVAVGRLRRGGRREQAALVAHGGRQALDRPG
jgi:hypothetical protein